MKKLFVILLVIAFLAPSMAVYAETPVERILMAKRLPFHYEYNAVVQTNVELNTENVRVAKENKELKGLTVFLGIVVLGVLSHFAGQNGGSDSPPPKKKCW